MDTQTCLLVPFPYIATDIARCTTAILGYLCFNNCDMMKHINGLFLDAHTAGVGRVLASASSTPTTQSPS